MFNFDPEMTQKTIDFLKAQLEDEPDNLQARLQLAGLYIQVNELDKGTKQTEFILRLDPENSDAKMLLTLISAKAQNPEPPKPKSSPSENSNQDLLLHQETGNAQKDIEKWFEKPKTTFEKVGGMKELKEEIHIGIIYPFQKPELYAKYGKKIGGGMLLYGPPGCGKTFIARATAGEIDAEFISVGIEEVLDMYIGQSEKNIHQLFTQAREMSPTVMFFDEVDALSSDRLKNNNRSSLVNQFLTEMDGLNGDNDRIMIIGATNAPWQVDPAFKRPGRFDKVIFVPPPDSVARAEIFKLCLQDKPTATMDYLKLADMTSNYSGADITKICDLATEEVVREVFSGGSERDITMKDMEKAIKSTHSSVKEWFATAKNFARFANESGNYSPILDYIQKNKLNV